MLDKTVGRFGLGKQAAKWKVVRQWAEITGDAISKISRPLKVVGSTLYVGTSSSSWATELDLRKPEIVALIKKHLGDVGIRDIRFQSASWPAQNQPASAPDRKLAPAQKEKILALTEKIENASVRKALKRVLIQDALNRNFKGSKNRRLTE